MVLILHFSQLVLVVPVRQVRLPSLPSMKITYHSIDYSDEERCPT